MELAKTQVDCKPMLEKDHIQWWVVLGQNRRVLVWWFFHEAYKPECIFADCKPKVSVMIWGCITWCGPGTLYMVNVNINAENYISILDDRLWSFLSYHFPENSYTFQDDNTPIHWAHLDINTKTTSMEWFGQLSHSTKLLQKIVGIGLRELYKLGRCNIHPRSAVRSYSWYMAEYIRSNPDQLFKVIFDIWQNIFMEYMRNHYQSLPQKLLACIWFNGKSYKDILSRTAILFC